jgi:hypothetical protein
MDNERMGDRDWETETTTTSRERVSEMEESLVHRAHAL